MRDHNINRVEVLSASADAVTLRIKMLEEEESA